MVRSESAGPSFPQRGGGCAVSGASVECGVRGVGSGTEIAALDVLSTSRTRRVWMVRTPKECGALCSGSCTFCAGACRKADGRNSAYSAFVLGLLAVAARNARRGRGRAPDILQARRGEDSAICVVCRELVDHSLCSAQRRRAWQYGTVAAESSH